MSLSLSLSLSLSFEVLEIRPRALCKLGKHLRKHCHPSFLHVIGPIEFPSFIYSFINLNSKYGPIIIVY
jgi:hypothetical protein